MAATLLPVEPRIKTIIVQNVQIVKTRPNPRKEKASTNKSLANFLKDFDFDSLEDTMDVVTVTMSANWLTFLSKRQELFFVDGVRTFPMPGPTLMVNVTTEEYVVTVFSKARL